MSQIQWALVLLKVGVIWGAAAGVAWVAVYHVLSAGQAWRNPLGRTYLIKSLIVTALLAIVAMSLFLNFNRLTSEVALWIQTVLILAIGPVLTWRMVDFWRARNTALRATCPHCGEELGSSPAGRPAGR